MMMEQAWTYVMDFPKQDSRLLEAASETIALPIIWATLFTAQTRSTHCQQDTTVPHLLDPFHDTL
jgi:hypothetical protein